MDNCVTVFLASTSITSFVVAINSILTTGVLCLNIWFLIRKLRGKQPDDKDDSSGKALLLFLLASALSGCGTLVPEKRSQSQAFDSAESLHTKNALAITKSLETTPLVPVRPRSVAHPVAAPKQTQAASASASAQSIEPFDENAWAWPVATKQTVTVTDNSETGAGANEAAKGWKESQIPFGVSLCLLALGILALVYAWKVVRNSSASIAAASDTADQFAAGIIRKLRDRATHSTDPSELARLNSDIASLEADRGRLAGK